MNMFYKLAYLYFKDYCQVEYSLSFPTGLVILKVLGSWNDESHGWSLRMESSSRDALLT